MNSARTSKKTQHFTITKIFWLMQFNGMVRVCTENHYKPINTNCKSYWLLKQMGCVLTTEVWRVNVVHQKPSALEREQMLIFSVLGFVYVNILIKIKIISNIAITVKWIFSKLDSYTVADISTTECNGWLALLLLFRSSCVQNSAWDELFCLMF
jgi:hypothetical protein